VNKGDRVKILAGQGEGQCGEVFWKGPNKWGSGERLGIRGDDGGTYWANDGDVEPSRVAAPAPDPGPRFEKGDRVSFKQRGQPGQGTVFWIGQSRSGAGQRLGVRPDDDDEAVWLDARFAQPLQEPIAPEPAAAPMDEPSDYDESPPSLDVDDGPPPPPMDDDYIDQLASVEDEADDYDIPPEW